MSPEGPYLETKEWLVGFYLLDCASDAEAVARAKQIAPDPDHAVEVSAVRPVKRARFGPVHRVARHAR
jgi:hypothetical protein